MSYEGREYYLCGYGHLAVVDAYDETPSKCSSLVDGVECGWHIVYQCSIDDTNCDGGTPALRIKDEVVTQTCDCCGHTKIISDVTYYPGKSDKWQDGTWRKVSNASPH